MVDKKEAKTKKVDAPLPTLATMLGSGEDFFAQGKKYRVNPLKLKDVDDFQKDSINIGPQMFSLVNEVERKKLEKWFSKQVFDGKEELMTLQKAMDDDWDLSDLRRCIQKMIDISG